MDPNSAHQLWSRWTATITTTPTTPPFEVVKENCARFYRKAFGSATELQITSGNVWTIDCRTEGAPANDPTWVAWMTDQLAAFLLNGFGAGSAVDIEVKVEAGVTGNGQPPDQLILGPPRVVLINRLLRDEEE